MTTPDKTDPRSAPATPLVIPIRTTRTFVLVHNDINDAVVVVAGTPGMLVETWMTDKTLAAMDEIGRANDGWVAVDIAASPTTPNRHSFNSNTCPPKGLEPVIIFERAIRIDRDPNAEVASEWEFPGKVETDVEISHGIPWDAITYAK